MNNLPDDADLIKIILKGIVDLGIFLCRQEDEALLDIGRFKGLNRAGAPDKERRDHRWKDDDVTQGDEGIECFVGQA